MVGGSKRVARLARNDVGYGELLVRHYELRFVCRTPQRCRQCIRLQPATSPQERCNTSLPTRQFGNLGAEMRYIWSLEGRLQTSREKRPTREREREREGGREVGGNRASKVESRKDGRGRVRSLQPLSIPRGPRCN